MDAQGIVEIATETKSQETVCQNRRIQFLKCLKSHFYLMKLFSVEHKKLLERMSILSTKLNIIECDHRPKCLPYTRELIWRVKGEILNSLNSILSKINSNLQQLSSSFANLRQNHELFIIASKAIDLDNHSRLSNGSATEKPLFYYVEHSFDIMYCLSIYEKNIQYNRLHLNVRDSNLINKFLNAISISQNLQDLIAEVLLNSYFIDRTEKVRNKS